MIIKIERNGFQKLDFSTFLLKICDEFSICKLSIRSELNHNFKLHEFLKAIKFKCSEIKKLSPIYKTSLPYTGEGQRVPDSVEHYEVFIFLKKQLKMLNLDEFCMNQFNKSIFYKFCKHLISMSYKSYISLSDICKSMKINAKWRSYILSEVYIHVITYLLFYDFIVPILKHNFHWCESPIDYSTVVYFTFSHWHEFQKSAALYYINRGIFSGPINKTSIEELKKYKVANVRCLIKNLQTHDYRLISNLKLKHLNSGRPSRKKVKIIHSKLLNLLEFFQSLKLKKPDLLTDDLYAPISFEEIKKFRIRMQNLGKNKFFIVRADVKNCYESLRHQDLRSMFSDLISKTKDPEILFKKASLKSEFYEFLDHIYVKFGSDYYQQICGIPQGSHLSSYLCGIYMLHIKKKALFDFSLNEEIIFHQYVDDVLFISYSKETAESFLERLLTVYPKYGLELNNSKIICSWQQSNLPSIIPWLGYNISDSCEVTLKVNNQLKTLSRFAGIPRNAKNSLNNLKFKLSYALKWRAIIANNINDNSSSDAIIKCNCELLGKLSAYIFLCRVRNCLESHELLSGTSSQKIADLLKGFLFNYVEKYEHYEVALKSLKETLQPYKGQMKWILHYL